MNPLRLTAENYRSFERLDLDLPSGTVAVVGENGAGKSSIVNVVDLALFGPPSRNLGDYLAEDVVDEALVLCLEFEHRGELYRVRRSYSPKGRGQTKLDFEKCDEDVALIGAPWLPLTRETAASTQSLIEETLGLSRETFRASAFLAQGDGAAFTEAQPRERKAILAEVLGLAVWDKLLERAKADHQQIEAKLAFARQSIGAAGEELERRPFLESRKADLAIEQSDLLADVARIEEHRTDTAKRLTAAREAAAELKGAREALAAREAELQRVQKRVAEISEQERATVSLKGDLAAAAELSEKIPALERELAAAREQAEKARERAGLMKQLDSVSDENLLIERGIEAATTKLKALRSGEAKHCDRCAQELPDEARALAIQSFQDDLDALDEKHVSALARRGALIEQIDAIPVPDLTFNAVELEKELAAARTAESRVREITARLERLDELRAERELHERGLPELERDVDDRRRFVADQSTGQPDAGLLENDLADVELRLRGLRGTLEENQKQTARAEAELERLLGLAERVESEQRQIAALQTELDVVLLAERAYGRDGIPALILEASAIPYIEVEAQRILSMLGGKTASATIELRTQRALKSGDGVRESLDIVITTVEATEREYALWSGGERMRINLALRLALAQLLANRRGSDIGIFVLDEPGDLDAQGKAGLIALLQELHTKGVERVYLVSHDPDLRDAFDTTLEVLTDGNHSWVEGSREEVAA